VLKIRKTNYRSVQTTGVSAQSLRPITVMRKLNNRSSGQYKIIHEDKTETHFRNFKELRFYNNLILRNEHKHMILDRENKIAIVNIFSYPPERCR